MRWLKLFFNILGYTLLGVFADAHFFTALSISISESFLKKVIQVAQFVPDFIILNLNKSESITRVMQMRGYGKSIPRSVYPFIKFTFLDLTLILLIPIILIGVHSIG